MTLTVIRSRRLRDVILYNEKYLNPSEVSMAKSILSWLPYEQKKTDSLDFFVQLRARELKSHKVHARFAMTMFEMAGAHYN